MFRLCIDKNLAMQNCIMTYCNTAESPKANKHVLSEYESVILEHWSSITQCNHNFYFPLNDLPKQTEKNKRDLLKLCYNSRPPPATPSLWWIISTQPLTSLCINPSPPRASRSDSVSNLGRCCVWTERRTSSTASSLFRALSTAHICIDLSCFLTRGMGGSDTKRLIPIDLHWALLVHLSFIW